MSTDFQCEKRLAELNPYYHTLVKNSVFVLSRILEKYKTFFPDFTDHTILHSLQVLDFCNRLLGDQVSLLNEDELYILIMSAYLHDSGMGISETDYRKLYDTVVSEEYRLAHPVDNTRETIRSFHQRFSRQFINKYAQLFDIPTPEHVQAIALVSEAHRRVDLFSEDILPSVMIMPGGNEVHLPFLAALIRLADELDIGADRNLGREIDERETIFKMMHRSIRHLHILPDRFVLDVVQDDPALFSGIVSAVDHLRTTLSECVEAVSSRTSFSISQSSVEINRLPSNEKHITVLDTDLGTDDACALLLLKILPEKPDYIVATFGNTSLDGACRNAVILRKYLGLSSRIARGLSPPDDPDLPLSEKGTFHGEDGLANCTEDMISSLNITGSELNDVVPFEDFVRDIMEYDSITYITIGALTNLSYLLDSKDFCRKIRGIYVMGGGLSEFNCSHDTEFNFSKDPDSVRRILSSGLNITLFPLDVTNHQRIDENQIAELEQTGRYPEYIRFLRHNLRANSEFNGIPAAVLHDTLPVLYLSFPEWFTLQDMRIASDCHARTYTSPDGEAIHVCTEMEKDKLFEILESAFEN